MDDTAVEQLSMDELEWHIFGPQEQTVRVDFFRPNTGQTFQVQVLSPRGMTYLRQSDLGTFTISLNMM